MVALGPQESSRSASRIVTQTLEETAQFSSGDAAFFARQARTVGDDDESIGVVRRPRGALSLRIV